MRSFDLGVSIGALPQDNITREVIGFSGARLSIDTSDEVELQIIMRAFDGRPPWGFAAAVDESYWVGVGHARLMTIGSRWRHGHFIGERNLQVGRYRFKLGSRDPLQQFAGRDLEDPEWPPLAALREGFCYELELPSMPELRIFLPVVEVLRSLFLVSSDVARLLFDGVSDPRLGRDRSWFDRAMSRYDADNATVQMFAHRQLSSAEAQLGAMLVSDARVRATFDEVNQSVRLGRWRNGASPISTPFPFPQPTTWQVQYLVRNAVLDGQETKIAIISRVQQVQPDLAFKYVKVAYPGSKASQAPRAAPRKQVERRSSDHRISARSSPSSSISRFKVRARDAGIIGRFVLQSEPMLEPGRPPTVEASGPANPRQADASTSARQGSSGGRGANVVSTGTRGDLEAHRTLEAVRRLMEDGEIQAQAFGQQTIDGLPVVPLHRKRLPRAAVVVAINRKGRGVCLIDARTSNRSHRAVGIVSGEYGRALSEAELERVIDEVTYLGGAWSRIELPGLHFSKVNHPRKAESDERFAARLLGKIDKLLDEACRLY